MMRMLLSKSGGALIIALLMLTVHVSCHNAYGESLAWPHRDAVVKYNVKVDRHATGMVDSKVSIESEFEVRELNLDTYEVRVLRTEMREVDRMGKESRKLLIGPQADVLVMKLVRKGGGFECVRKVRQGDDPILPDMIANVQDHFLNTVVPNLFINKEVDFDALEEDGERDVLSQGDDNGLGEYSSKVQAGPWKIVQNFDARQGNLLQLMSYNYDEYEVPTGKDDARKTEFALSRHIRHALVHKPSRLVLHGGDTRIFQRFVKVDGGVQLEHDWMRIELFRVE